MFILIVKLIPFKYLKLNYSIKEKYSEKHDKLKKIVELINS